MSISPILQKYAEQGIKLTIAPKRVKNINFRLRPIDEAPFSSLLTVSYPNRMPQKRLFQSLQNRYAWAVDCQAKQQILQQQPKTLRYLNDTRQIEALTLESEIFYQGKKMAVKDLLIDEGIKSTDLGQVAIGKTLIKIYKHCIQQFIQTRQAYWESMIGKNAVTVTPYTMKTRWGSCSIQARTIRLSIWLAQFPEQCLDYVLVHELCHLHEGNHSSRFWAHVIRAMPDYKIWHNQLKQGVL